MPSLTKTRYAALGKPSDSKVMTLKWLACGGISIERLNTFMKIAAAGSIVTAAQGDPVRQSQFSRQLTELESALSAVLFVRGRNRSWTLTTTGQRLFEILNHFFGDLGSLLNEGGHRKPEISFGAGESFLQWVFLQRKASNGESFTFKLENLQSHDIAARLEDGRLDLGVLPESEVPFTCLAISLATLQHSLFVPASMLKSGIKSVSTKSLPRILPMAVMNSNPKVEEFMRRSLPEIEIVAALSCSSMPQIVSAITAGESLAAVLPSVAKSLLPESVVTFSLEGMRAFSRKLVLAHHKRSPTLRPDVAMLAQRLGRKLTLT